MDAQELPPDLGFTLVASLPLARRQPKYFTFEDLPISQEARAFLSTYSAGIYGHQKEGISKIIAGRNLCLATGTSSGKTAVFFAGAIERLSRDPRAIALAIYPAKALGREQEDRWRRALIDAGMEPAVGRIDGGVDTRLRLDLLRNSRVITATPDVLHAWLLSNLSQTVIKLFLKSVSIIIVDEVHTYTGVFGSNAAFFFRRLRYLQQQLGGRSQFVCASATIADPQTHLQRLFALEFDVVGEDKDTSPAFGNELHLITPPREEDLLTETSRLLRQLATSTQDRFIAFVDSRKQAEHISSIVTRGVDGDDADVGDPEEPKIPFDALKRLQVLPFRAGFEEEDREVIFSRLRQSALKGVVSTSSLELGIDIPGLTVGVLVGVPRSSTSLLQRIGRIGRQRKGNVYVINAGDVLDEAIFREPTLILQRPFAESALYLENPRIQYIHTLCLARAGGEHDQVTSGAGDTLFRDSTVVWPDGFTELCRKERIGELPVDLQNMKAESGDQPNRVFPLRDVESQFQVQRKQGPETHRLGSLSYRQVLREAYPGSVYYYATHPFRVYRVSLQNRQVQVRSDRRYTTRPKTLPTLVFPNLSEGNVFRGAAWGDLTIIEANLQVRERIVGFKERRGRSEFDVNYPLDGAKHGIYFDLPQFSRNFFTTGVIVNHPRLDSCGSNIEDLASYFFEAFLMGNPFERQDIAIACDRHRATRGPIPEGARFIALFDQVYGSLRLSGRLMEDGVLGNVLATAIELAAADGAPVIDALDAMRSALDTPIRVLDKDQKPTGPAGSTLVRVIMPGGRGLNVRNENEEFEVESIFFNPVVSDLCYRGHTLYTAIQKRGQQPTTTILPVSAVVPVPGESIEGDYDLMNGEVYPRATS
jgi:DEAD/DEAH box helicase domain-containing protein